MTALTERTTHPLTLWNDESMSSPCKFSDKHGVIGVNNMWAKRVNFGLSVGYDAVPDVSKGHSASFFRDK